MEDPEHFYPRPLERRRILDTLIKHNKVVLAGTNGSGKTLLAQHIACSISRREDLQEGDPRINPSQFHPNSEQNARITDNCSIDEPSSITEPKVYASGSTLRNLTLQEVDIDAEPEGLNYKIKLEGATIEKINSSLKVAFQHIEKPIPKQPCEEISKSVDFIFNDLLKIIEKSDGFHVILIDNLKQETKKIFDKKVPNNVIFIFTTNNQTLFPKFKVEIKGFDDEDAINFFRDMMQETGNEEEWREHDIREFCNFFSNLPLGLTVGVAALQNTHKSIEVYLETLKKSDPRQKMGLIDAGKTALYNYDENLISALMNAIVDSRFGNQEEPMAKVMECAIYMDIKNLSGKLIKTIALDTNPRFSEADAEGILGDLILEMKRTSLGEATGKDDNTNVCLHECVQFAWILTLSQADSLHHSLAFLKGHSSKDNRFLVDFRSLGHYMSHINEVLGHLNWSQRNPEINFRTKILAIQLYDVMGHLYCQNQEPFNGKIYMERALVLFYDNILKSSEHSLEQIVKRAHDFENLPESDLLANMAEIIYEKLQITEIEQVTLLTEQEILKRKYSKREQAEWKNIIPELNQDCDFTLSNGCLDERMLNYLQDMNVFLPVETQSQIFLTELLMSILYTRGRVYFYLKDRFEVTLDDRKDYTKSIELALKLGKLVKDRMKVYLMQYTLIITQGVLRMKLEAPGKTNQQLREDYMYAIAGYTSSSGNTDKCYEMGMLKSCPYKNIFHQLQCLKMKCRCIVGLIDISEEPLTMEDIERELPRIGTMENMLKANPDLREAVNIADCYNQLGGLYLKLAKTFKGGRLSEKAFGLYLEGFESAYEMFSKKLNDFRFNHTLWEALIGLVDVLEEYPNEQRAANVETQVKRFEEIIRLAKSSSKACFLKEMEVADNLRIRLTTMIV